MEKQDKYKTGKNTDLIDHWACTKTPGEFRAIMIAQMEKYQTRYGKKDDLESESYKIMDYATRLYEYECKIKEDPNYFKL